MFTKKEQSLKQLRKFQQIPSRRIQKVTLLATVQSENNSKLTVKPATVRKSLLSNEMQRYASKISFELKNSR